MNSKNFSFDDEKGNNFNITVNHFHMVPENPMGNLMNLMGQMTLFNAMAKNNLLDNQNNEIAIENKGVKLLGNDADEIKYEIKDETEYKNFDLTISKMYTVNGLLVIKAKFADLISLDDFEKYSRNIAECVKHKLAMVAETTDSFIFEFDAKNVGTVSCAYSSNTDYFTGLFNKFSNGKSCVTFNRNIGDKLKVPFIEKLNDIDFVIDMKSLFKSSYDLYSLKYKISFIRSAEWEI